MIGCDTSHAPKFAELLAKKFGDDPAASIRVVAVVPTKSDDISASFERVEKFTEDLRKQGVEVVDSVEALLPKVDAVMIESVDGRAHLEQARPVLVAGKPLFIDKPVAASLADVIAIFELAEKHNTPCFTSSSLRFSPDVAAARSALAGKVVGCETHSPCKLEPHHPDLFWYGIHGVEMLFAIMGPGCESVSRTQTDGTDVVVGVWKDGRVGTFRGTRAGAAKYGTTIYGEKNTMLVPVKDAGYEGLVKAIGEFFQTRQSPVNSAETVEIFTFMEAADESKRRGGAPVRLDEVLKKSQ
jgi:predicted dehydrogenase